MTTEPETPESLRQQAVEAGRDVLDAYSPIRWPHIQLEETETEAIEAAKVEFRMTAFRGGDQITAALDAADTGLTAEELGILAERCRDAWAVLRIVPARDGEEALRRHGRKYDAERFIGTRDGLADDMLDAAKALDAAAERCRMEPHGD